MSSVKDEIRSAIEKLNLPPLVFRELPDDEAENAYRTALRHFVPEGDPRWWWEHFTSQTAVDFPAGDGWQHIEEFVPDASERVWFVVEDDALPFYPVYAATPAAIRAIIAECYGFEYYIIQREFQWLLCETHHNRMIGVGAAVEERLRDYVV
jgi:uncharacterized protein DUF6756